MLSAMMGRGNGIAIGLHRSLGRECAAHDGSNLLRRRLTVDHKAPDGQNYSLLRNDWAAKEHPDWPPLHIKTVVEQGAPWTPKTPRVETATHETFLFFLLFSILEIGVLVYIRPDFTHWRDWIIAAGAIFFPILAVISFLSMRRNWTGAKPTASSAHAGFVVLLPIALVAIVFAGFALYAAFGWFGTIPSSAAVIVVLLLLIYLKK